MGRAISGSSQPQRQIVTLTASNASVPIPSWARGGKGSVRINAAGGGGSGLVANSTTLRGGGGGSGGQACDALFNIPANASTVAVVIGAGGAAASTASATIAVGSSGGDTRVTVGTQTLVLKGGAGATDTMNMVGGVGGAAFATTDSSEATMARVPAEGGAYPSTGRVFAGQIGGRGNTSSGLGAGGQSQFGAGGAGIASVSALTNGAAGSGFGSGGAGATNWNTAGGCSSGAGAPGVVILEFIQGV